MMLGNHRFEPVKRKTLYRCEFQVDFWATVFVEKDPVRMGAPGSSDSRKLTIIVHPGERLEIETEGYWTYVTEDLGPEKNNGIPHSIAVPEEYEKPLSLREEMRRYIRSEISAVASQQGMETLEEANDFEVDDDDDDILSPYEVVEMEADPGPGPEPLPAEPEAEPRQGSPQGEPQPENTAEPPTQATGT